MSTPPSIDDLLGDLKPEPQFGVRNGNGRYTMPLLPGEQGTKSGGNWVPRGLTSVTSLTSLLEDKTAVALWAEAMLLIGIGQSGALRMELLRAVSPLGGNKVGKLRESPELQHVLIGSYFEQDKKDESLAGRAKEAAGWRDAAALGTARHAAWEQYGESGELPDDQDARAHVLEIQLLLEEAGLVRVPELRERTVRNLEVKTAGRFDDILMSATTGKLYLADLKTSQRDQFFSMTSMDAQLAIYARSEWMLTEDCQGYEPGPRQLGVDQERGIIMHVRADGGPGKLVTADLTSGWRGALLARELKELRSAGTSKSTLDGRTWRE